MSTREDTIKKLEQQGIHVMSQKQIEETFDSLCGDVTEEEVTPEEARKILAKVPFSLSDYSIILRRGKK